ncbi:MAG: hypothetical protein IKY26_06330 [Erysipelotrichaceae bacterium]|nr:hypothetical protein [Erysipelotrichaceae bacterium]
MAKPGRKKKTVKDANVVQDIIETTEIVENANTNSMIEEIVNSNGTHIIEDTKSPKVEDDGVIIDTGEIIEEQPIKEIEIIVNADIPTTIEETSSTTVEHIEENETALTTVESTEIVEDKHSLAVIEETEIVETLPPLEEKTTKKDSSFFATCKMKWKQTFDWLHNHMFVYRILQITLCIFLFIGANIATSALTYFGYIQYKYYRIPDGEELDVERNRTWYLAVGNTYTAVTMDIGHGIHVPEYSNINETGKMTDGTKTQGIYNYGIDETVVLDNVTKMKDYIRHLDVDFYALQDMDVASTRSYMINQYEEMNEALSRYSRVAARYHHTQYLVYPFDHPIGLINNDIVTYSRYKTTYGFRQQLPINTTFTSRLAAIDNGFSATFMPINGSDGKYLVILNISLDKDASIRKQQMDVINAFMLEEYEYGNYVIVAGNFNADTATVDGNFANQQQTPTWLSDFDETQITEGFAFVHPTNETELANFRTTDLPYEQGVNYQAHTSGFIVSNNITAESVILDTNYQYSNHNPVQLKFKLNKPEKK